MAVGPDLPHPLSEPRGRTCRPPRVTAAAPVYPDRPPTPIRTAAYRGRVDRSHATTSDIEPADRPDVAARARRRRCRAGTRPSGPILLVAIAVVAVLAGGALFMSGLHARPPDRASSRARRSARTRRSARSGTPTTRSTTATPAATSTATRSSRARSAGMIEALGDPYSSYLTSEEYRDSLQGISGEFEGIGAEIATAGRRRDAGLRDPRAGLPARHRRAARRLAGREGRAAPGDLVLAADGVSLDGLTVDGARDRIRGPKGTRRDPDRRSAAATSRSRSRSPATSSSRRRSRAATSPTGPSATSGSTASPTAARPSSQARPRARTSTPDRTKLILDLRGNPGGYVTAARDVASQFIASGPVFWEQDADGRADRRPTRSPAAPPRTRRSEVVCLDRRRQRVGQRDRRRGAPGHRPGDARRPDDVRQGHRPAVAGADRRGRRVPADHRPLADARQALDPRRRASSRTSPSSCPTDLRRRTTTRPSIGRSRSSAATAAGAGLRDRRLTAGGPRRRCLRSHGVSGTVLGNERR